jgi:hypothetical protein
MKIVKETEDLAFDLDVIWDVRHLQSVLMRALREPGEHQAEMLREALAEMPDPIYWRGAVEGLKFNDQICLGDWYAE